MNIQTMFNSIAPTYDKVNRVLSLSQDVRWRKKSIAAIKHKPALSALDLCAGTLDMSIEIFEQNPTSNITAVDFSQEMLDYGVQKLNQDQLKQIKVSCEDALNLSQTNETFDVVTCAFGMRNLPDQDRAIKEIARVLRPNGQFIILEFFHPTTLLAKLFAATYGKYILPLVGGAISKQKSAYNYLHQSTNRFHSIDEYKAILGKHGFTIESINNLSGGIANLVVSRLQSKGN